jgi:cytochrome oxidase Cu insertion factor (SCO1/SenC/PrrC family)/Cu/Ag efflux protein CusF
VKFFRAAVALALAVGALCADTLHGQQLVTLRIIVVPTADEATRIERQLADGADFAMLAAEWSTEPTARDGGFLGAVDPSSLRPELRDALNGIGVGKTTGVVKIGSGYAILKVVPMSESAIPSGSGRVATLSVDKTGLVYGGLSIGGLSEADAVLLASPKREGWNQDLRALCEYRTSSVTSVIDRLRALPAFDPLALAESDRLDEFEAQYAWGQLHAYRGELNQAIERWSVAHRIAENGLADALPRIDETLGVGFLHKAENDNDVYNAPGDRCLFPPSSATPYRDTAAARQAVAYMTKYLEKKPDDLEVRWLLNLAYVELGGYPASVPAAQLIPPSAFASTGRIGRFTDVAARAGLKTSSLAGGTIVDDFDNDGHLDVMTSSMDMCESLHYFHNDGDGRFTEKTAKAGLSSQLGGLNLVQADYNNDGCVDVLVERGGWEFPMKPSLLRNNCNGTFTDVTSEAGLPATIRTQAAVFADYDNDGNLDLFLGSEDGRSRLYHNNGKGGFDDVTEKAKIDVVAFIKAVVAADYDNDGYVDFYLTNYEGHNVLLHNNRDGTFTDVGKAAGVQAPWRSFAAWFFDYDNDGWPDLFVTSYYISTDESVRTYLGRPHNAETLKLYHNQHDGTFKDVSADVGLDKVWMPMAANFGDVNNDGYLDIYLGMGSPSFTSVMPHELLLNVGGKSFVNATAASGLGELHKGHGIAFADLDRDGDEDIVAEIGGAVPADRHALRVFENPGNTNNWINMKLVGVRSNRSAIGARIALTVDGREIHRTVSSGGSFGANPLEMHVGLGSAARIQKLEVWWPATNSRQTFTDVAANQFVQITEFGKDLVRLDRRATKLGGAQRATSAVPERHDVTGLVLSVDAARLAMSVSTDSLPGFMPAMVMPFTVKDAALLKNVKPGASIAFTVVIDGETSYVESLKVRRYENLEQKPSEFKRLELLSRLASDQPATTLDAGQRVPDFAFVDQQRRPVSLSQLSGKVVALTFTYVRCPNPAYCFRLASNFSQLQRRFKDRLGDDLVLLTIAIDPALDQGDALAEYARTWTTSARGWHFLTGSLADVKRVAGQFGVQFWQDEGQLTHSFHTAVIDRRGTLVANLEGNAFTAAQLGDLVQTTLDPPLVDNDRVNVRERPTIGGPAGSIVRQTSNEIWISVTPAKAIAITLKDKKVAPIANTSGFPNAFPRPRNIKLYEDQRVIVWDYTWTPGVATPMHFHDKDVVVIYFGNGSLRSTTPDGKSVVNKWTTGDTRFNLRDRVHTETLVDGQLRAIITELK